MLFYFENKWEAFKYLPKAFSNISASWYKEDWLYTEKDVECYAFFIGWWLNVFCILGVILLLIYGHSIGILIWLGLCFFLFSNYSKR